jgi:hypothetical protein
LTGQTGQKFGLKCLSFLSFALCEGLSHPREKARLTTKHWSNTGQTLVKHWVKTGLSPSARESPCDHTLTTVVKLYRGSAVEHARFDCGPPKPNFFFVVKRELVKRIIGQKRNWSNEKLVKQELVKRETGPTRDRSNQAPAGCNGQVRKCNGRAPGRRWR